MEPAGHAERFLKLLLSLGALATASIALWLLGVVAIVLGAMLDGTWSRLKACRNCCWSFYDYSPNRSATWCSMQLCGNRSKTRTYRTRRRAV